MDAQKDLDATLKRLSGSTFRSRFHLDQRDRTYLDSKGRAEIVQHARGFVAERLAPAQPRNDGQQTPMRGHPVFVAQHATATCCRGCLDKWHGISAGNPLTRAEQDFVVALIGRWLELEAERPLPSALRTSRQRAEKQGAAKLATQPADETQPDLFSLPQRADTDTKKS